MRRLALVFVVPAALILLPGRASAQCVSYQGYSYSNSVTTIGVRSGSGWTETNHDLPPISSAVGLWSSGCSGMFNSDFPELVANQNGSITVTVNYLTGPMPSNSAGQDSCLRFVPDVNGSGQVVGGSVEVYQYTTNGADCVWVLPAVTLSHGIAHELGHVLGLANTPCSGYLMGPSWTTAGPNSDECGWVDQTWSTPQEQNDECSAHCWTTCDGGVCPNKYTQPGCGDDCSPIVLGFGNARYAFTAPLDGTLFDIDADGRLDRVAWVTEPASIGFLFLDKNRNDVPDNGSELFGNATTLYTGEYAANGFEALRELDSNGDGVVTDADAQWSRLRLWFDMDTNGKADPQEVLTLDEMSINVLQLDATWTGRRDANGNMLKWKAMYGRMSPKQTWRPFYDVYLKIAR